MNKTIKRDLAYYFLPKPLYFRWKNLIGNLKGFNFLRQWFYNNPTHEEEWHLDEVIGQFISPRIQRLAEQSACCIPNSLWSELGDKEAKKQWAEIMEKIVWSWKYINGEIEFDYFELEQEERQTMEDKKMEGLRLFAKYYNSLWY